jgi:hypothetical protein
MSLSYDTSASGSSQKDLIKPAARPTPVSCLPGFDQILLVDTDLLRHRNHEVPLVEAEQEAVGQVPRNEGVEESADAKGIGSDHVRGVCKQI